MGTYKISKTEIKDKFKEMLDDLEGEVYRKDVEDAVHTVIIGYEHFSY